MMKASILSVFASHLFADGRDDQRDACRRSGHGKHAIFIAGADVDSNHTNQACTAALKASVGDVITQTIDVNPLPRSFDIPLALPIKRGSADSIIRYAPHA